MTAEIGFIKINFSLLFILWRNMYLHVEVIMPREVGVQNEFFNLVVFCIEQNILETNDVSVVRRLWDLTYHPEREVVVKIVWLQQGGFPMGVRRMNFHFVFWFVKYSVWSAHCRHHILHAVTEFDCFLQRKNQVWDSLRGISRSLCHKEPAKGKKCP